MALVIPVPKLAEPLVLVHGLFGFDSLRIGGWEALEYFRGIVEHLRSGGNTVFVPRLSPTAGIADRAKQLASFIDQMVPEGKVHIIAHSMGGLDSRYMISKCGMGERVASLTTVGTPHRGSSFAKWSVSRLERFIRPVLEMMQIPYQAFYDLTPDHCARFNEEVTDDPRVRYYSVAGVCKGFWLGLEWMLPHFVMKQAEGDNDGLVSVESAKYGRSVTIWEGDHLSLVNWPNARAVTAGIWRPRFDNYASLLQHLVVDGFDWGEDRKLTITEEASAP